MTNSAKSILHPPRTRHQHRSVIPTNKAMMVRSGDKPSTCDMLFSEDFLHLADFLLDLPTYLFDLAFGFQIGIVRRSSNLLFNSTFHLVKLSSCFVLSASLHWLSPLTQDFHFDTWQITATASTCKVPLPLSVTSGLSGLATAEPALPSTIKSGPPASPPISQTPPPFSCLLPLRIGRPYGSVFVRNSVRWSWGLQRGEAADKMTMPLALFHDKHAVTGAATAGFVES